MELRETPWCCHGAKCLQNNEPMPGRTTHSLRTKGDFGIHIQCTPCNTHTALQWRHNGCDGVSNHRRLDYLHNRCSGTDQRRHQNFASLAFGRGIHQWFPSQRASNAENIAIWWRHHELFRFVLLCLYYRFLLDSWGLFHRARRWGNRIDGLVQYCSISSAYALEILQFGIGIIAPVAVK